MFCTFILFPTLWTPPTLKSVWDLRPIASMVEVVLWHLASWLMDGFYSFGGLANMTTIHTIHLEQQQKKTQQKWGSDTWPCIPAHCVWAAERNVAGVCEAWTFTLYVVNRRKCWSCAAACHKRVSNFALTACPELVELQHVSQVQGRGANTVFPLLVLPDGTGRVNTGAVDNIFCWPEL